MAHLREWWISKLNPGYHNYLCAFIVAPPDNFADEYFHVVEYSALTSAQGRIKELEKERDEVNEKLADNMCGYCWDQLHAGQFSGLQSQLTACQEELKEAREVIREIDLTLRVPAAEYVPAIGDAFGLIDKFLAKYEGKK